MSVDGLKVTLSVGLAEYPEFDVGDQSKLVEAADGALYEAKRRGRNRTCAASPQGAPATDVTAA
jgi:PleD family two-component response regulator